MCVFLFGVKNAERHLRETRISEVRNPLIRGISAVCGAGLKISEPFDIAERFYQNAVEMLVEHFVEVSAVNAAAQILGLGICQSVEVEASALDPFPIGVP